MARALLLSPDDQAVSAITGVLEEMSVTCERPLDGVTAAQKLNSNNFDLVLVDCENLPAAKLIFDVCRRGKDGQTPVPIAIVDGRAGLPTAFRLGAELILTKPVAKDQARATIRTAVSRVRKTSTNDASTTQWMATASTATHLAPAGAGIPAAENRLAATATHSGVSAAPAAAAPAMAASPTVAPAKFASTQMSSAAQELEAPPDTSFETSSDAQTHEVKPPATFVSGSTVPRVPSDDPVLAELERQELGETPAVGTEASSSVASASVASAKKEQAEEGSAKKDSETKRADHTPSFYVEKKQPRGALVISLVFAVLAAGMYLAWMYQPGFRPLVEPQLNRVLVLLGLPLIESPAPAHLVQVASKPAVAASTTAPVTPDSTAAANAGSTEPAANSSSFAGAPPQASAAAPVPSAPAKPSAQTTAPPAASTAAPTQPKTESNSSLAKSVTKPADTKSASATSEASVAAPSTSPLPEESNTVILSSKGAQNRLEYSIQPKYPADAQAGGDGTVVLKVIVSDSGKVQGVRLVEGNPALATAAVRAVKQWRYRPFVHDGKTLAFQTVVMVDFQKP